MKFPALLPQIPTWAEGRMVLEARSLLRSPIYRGVGVEWGEGRPVMLIPGFLAGDRSVDVLRRWLRRNGHRTTGTGMYLNLDCSEATTGRLEQRLERTAERYGQRVTIVGQSRGGTFARVLAVRRPDLVAGIVTLGSPLVNPYALRPLVRLSVLAVGTLGTLGAPGLFRHACHAGTCCEPFWDDLAGPFPSGVGFVSVCTRSDGVVDYRACLDRYARCVEIDASHCGMGLNVEAYRELSRALAAFRVQDSAGERRRRLSAVA